MDMLLPAVMVGMVQIGVGSRAHMQQTACELLTNPNNGYMRHSRPNTRNILSVCGYLVKFGLNKERAVLRALKIPRQRLMSRISNLLVKIVAPVEGQLLVVSAQDLGSRIGVLHHLL